MKKNNVSYSSILIVFLLFSILISIITLYLLTTTSNNNKYFGDYNKKISNNLQKQLENQKNVDKKIIELSKENYDLDNPYIYNNPYGISPLTSLIIFKTKEECEVSVYINDVFVYTVSSSKTHLIPIYGLYSNANNYILLKTPDKEKTINIKTNVYDNTLDTIVETSMLEKEKKLVINPASDNKSTQVRAFDNNSNLMFYMNFDFITNIIKNDTNFIVEYNKENELQPIKLKLDYLGRILEINSNTSEFANVNGTEQTINFYPDVISNYNIEEIIDEENYSNVERIKTTSIEKSLIDAKMYNNSFKMSLNQKYLTYKFEDNIESIILVKKDSSYTYIYDAKPEGILKIDLNSNASVYVKSNGEYYCLITTLES